MSVTIRGNFFGPSGGTKNGMMAVNTEQVNMAGGIITFADAYINVS